MHFPCIIIITVSLHQNPDPWGHEIHYFGKGFISVHYNVLSLWAEERISKIYVFPLCTHFSPALTPEPLTLGPWISKFQKRHPTPHYYVLNLLARKVGQDFFQESKHFHNMSLDSSNRNSWAMNFKIWVKNSMLITIK